METLQLSDELYGLFRELLLRRSGLFYPEHKREDLSHGLSLVLKTTGARNLAELYSNAINDDAIWDAIVTHLTIGETNFFRNKPQFDALRNHIFPDIIERRTMLHAIRLWSAGCATGEEPYSIAMLLRDIVPEFASWHINILATDINPNFLLRAREGLYGNWSFRETPEGIKSRFFVQEGNRWRLFPEIRAMVTFYRLNLIELNYPSITNGTSALDMILCRNVTIYFNEQTTRKIVEHFYKSLAPGGWLIVGHSEPQASIYHQFEVHNFPNTVVYRKPPDAPLFPVEELAFFKSSFVPPTAATPAIQPNIPRAAQSDSPTGPSPTASSQPAPVNPLSQLPQLPSSPFVPKKEPIPSANQPPFSSVSSPASNLSRVTATPGLRPMVNEPQSAKSPLITSSSDKPVQDPQALLRQSKNLLLSGDKHGAEQLLNELLGVQPEHLEARTMMARICADRGEWGCAQYHCETAIKTDPLSIDAHYTLAQIYEHEEQYDDALSEYRRVIYLDRRFVVGMLGMANIWRRMGRLDEARRSYRNALKQLANLAPSEVVPGTEGATASELATFASRQLHNLE